MRILSTVALTLIAVAASAQSYTITGKTGEDSNGKTAYLIDQNTANVCDSCVIKDCAFKFENNISGEKIFDLNINKNRRNKVVVLAAAGTKAAVDFTTRPASVTDNGGYNDKLAAFGNTVAEAGNAINAKMDQLMNEGKSREEINAALASEQEAFYELYRKGISDNKDNVMGAYIVSMTARMFYPTLETRQR